MESFKQWHKFYGHQVIQNPSNLKLSMYCGAIDAKILRDIVSVDNAVKWDSASKVWREGGRNRTIIESHVNSIEEFLASGNAERIMPNSIVLSITETAFSFKAFPQMPEIDNVTPGIIKVMGLYKRSANGDIEPCPEKDRTGWVLDGQHRIKAFRQWASPDPYPVNVIILKHWMGNDYEDVMRHQTYELNMGRPLSEDFKSSIREQYNEQIGHKEYKRQIALSWIRRELEGRGAVFSQNGIVGASNLRTPYIITMSFLEKLIQFAFESDSILNNKYVLEKMTKNEAKEVSKYLFDFYEGVRISLGLINPQTIGTIGSEPEVSTAKDYWDIASKTKHKQRLLHNVGLKAVTKGLLHKVMANNPQNPSEVAESLKHMRGIPWHDPGLQAKKDDWVNPLAEALLKMYESKGTEGANKKYQIRAEKRNNAGNVIDTFNLQAFGWQ
ncbi:hypothetical protein OAJ77_03240 [Rhodospirillales bacterium]|nr:hypothetical protein [Rhodospirillales bacterium]